jgi:hypothetical protein
MPRGLKPPLIVEPLRGAEAPLFHGTASLGAVPTSEFSLAELPSGHLILKSLAIGGKMACLNVAGLS